LFSEEAYANPNTGAHQKKNLLLPLRCGCEGLLRFFLYLIHCNNEPDPSLNTRLILLFFCPIQPPFASGVFLLHLPESAARSSPSVASAGREDLGKAFRDWDPWGPFLFIVFLGLTLSWSASVKKLIKILALKLKAKASLDSALLLAFDLTQRTDSQLMSMIRYAINHIVKFYH
ncbi:unnamed protein product, partial [Brassica rapa]